MKKILKFFAVVIVTLILLEITSRVFVFSYLRNTLPESKFNALFYKSTFFYCVGGLFCKDSMYEYDLIELTHLKPNSRMDINSDGYRGFKVSTNKTNNSFRILCLGDSTTFGLFLPLESTYPYLLQKTLQNRYPEIKIEVINAGVPSTNSIEAKRRYQAKFMKYNPDLILWRSGFDLSDNLHLPDINFFDKICLVVKKKIVRSCLVNLILIPLKTSTYFDYTRKKISVPEGVTSNYHLVKLIAKEQGTRIIPVDWIRRNLRTEELISNFSSHNPIGEDYIDTLAYLKKSGYRAEDLLFNDAHLTEIGNSIIVEAIADYLDNNNIIK